MTKHTKKPQIRLARRDFLKLGGCGVLGTIIAAATTNVAGAQTPSVENVMSNLKALKLGEFTPNYSTQWSYRLASALGYLQDVGIDDFEVILSEEYIPGLIGGSLDITHGDTSEFFGAGHASGLPIKMISLYRDKEWWIMGARKGINKPDDLRGKKISGGGLQGRNTWVQREIIKKMGMDPDKDVDFVPASGGSDGRMAGIINGTLDAASVFPRHRAGLEEAGAKFLYEELVSAPQEGFAAMGDWLEKNEDTAYAWVRADLRARQWLFNPANQKRAYQLMIDLGFEIPPAFQKLYKVELDQISPDGGFASAKAMDQFVEDISATGGVPKGLDWRKYVDMKYVWAAQQSLGLSKRPTSL